jgi:hypothetical protein
MHKLIYKSLFAGLLYLFPYSSYAQMPTYKFLHGKWITNDKYVSLIFEDSIHAYILFCVLDTSNKIISYDSMSERYTIDTLAHKTMLIHFTGELSNGASYWIMEVIDDNTIKAQGSDKKSSHLDNNTPVLILNREKIFPANKKPS